MLAGHVGAGLWYARRSAPQVNGGWFVAAALWPDLLLWLLLLAGVETGRMPDGATHGYEMAYDFPYSHGLLAGVGWALAWGAAAWWRAPPRVRQVVAVGLAAAVLSHTLLDLVVHQPQLPLAGSASPHYGLRLWSALPWALALEAAITALGLVAFLRRAGLARSRGWALAGLCAAVMLFTAGGMLWAPPPPSVTQLALGGLVVQVLLCAAVAWIVRRPR